jgi:hypothetical protein
MGRHGGHQKPSPPPDVNNPPGQYPPQASYPLPTTYPSQGQYPLQGSYVPQSQHGASYGGYQQDQYGQPRYGPPQGPEGPQYQQRPGSQDAAPPPQRKKRHRVRRVLIISGAVITAVILPVAVVMAVSGKNKPAVATPMAQSYPGVVKLLAAMSAHGATCYGPSLKWVAPEVRRGLSCGLW